MESSKHNNELIKRKLADLSVEPRKLKFAEVHANYNKARKASANGWGLSLVIGAFGIAALVSAYIFLTPKTSDQLAENTVTAEYSTQNLSKEQSGGIQSVGTTSEDRSLERSDDKTITNDPNTLSNSANESETNTKEISKDELSTKETSSNNTLNKNVSINSVTKNNSTGSVNEKEASTLNKKETNTSTGSVTNNTSNNNKKSNTKKTSIPKNNILTNSIGQSKIDESLVKTNIKKQSQNPTYLKDVKEVNNKATNTQPLANSDVKNKTGDEDSDTKAIDLNPDNTKDIAKDETSQNNKGNTDQHTFTQKGSNDQDNNSNSDNANFEGKSEGSTDQVAKTDSVSGNNAIASKVDSATTANHIPGIIGTGSVSPRNKHKFLVGAEISYSTLFFSAKDNPNSPSQFSTGDPAFSTAYANALGKGKHSLFNGAASLNYVYNEGVGISAGVSYFNLETKMDIQPARTPQYTTAIDYVVWNSVVDSSISPPTLTFVADTVYKQVPTGNYNSISTTVNEDSASTSNYVNKVRYISIPLNLSYNFKIGAKFSIEPQAGIIYTMPLRSQHLVATDAYKFEYSKQKTDLRKNIYFNAALKIGYNISNRMQVYIREGYFFRNQSIYNADQPISLSLKSIYTSFGITFRIK